MESMTAGYGRQLTAECYPMKALMANRFFIVVKPPNSICCHSSWNDLHCMCLKVAYVVSEGVIRPLCNLLGVKDTQVIQVVLDGLHNILKLADEAVETVRTKIEECGGELLWILVTKTISSGGVVVRMADLRLAVVGSNLGHGIAGFF